LARDASKDPVTNVIGELHEREAARNPPKPQTPVVTQRTKAQQAWLPGTNVEAMRDSSAAASAGTKIARADSARAAPSGSAADSAAAAGDAAEQPPAEQRTAVITQKVTVTSGRLAAAPAETTALEATPQPAARDTLVASVPRLVAALPPPADTLRAEPPAPPAGERAATADTTAARVTAKPRQAPPDTSRARAAVRDSTALRAGTPEPTGSRAADAPKRYTVHVGSHKARASADAEAARWGRVGHEAFVVEKDLGEKGVWYRVMIGDFATSADANRFAGEFTTAFPGQYAQVVRRD
jgi:hypothetical protein